MPGKQEQELATEEITEVAPGVLRMQLPIQFTGLGHVNCYALEDERGFALVDPGLPGQQSWDGLIDRIGRAGAGLTRIHTVIVTHSHPDHFGGAARLQRERRGDPDAPLVQLWWRERRRTSTTRRPISSRCPRTRARPTPWGGEFRPPVDEAMSEMRAEMRDAARQRPRPRAAVDDAEIVTLGGREWVSLHTPGHTPTTCACTTRTTAWCSRATTCCPRSRPTFGASAPTDDPLAEFFASLERMVGAAEGVGGAARPRPPVRRSGRAGRPRSRSTTIERLDRLRTASEEIGRPAAVDELSQQLFPQRAWGPMAESETYAHLEHLRLLGPGHLPGRGRLCSATRSRA